MWWWWWQRGPPSDSLPSVCFSFICSEWGLVINGQVGLFDFTVPLPLLQPSPPPPPPQFLAVLLPVGNIIVCFFLHSSVAVWPVDSNVLLGLGTSNCFTENYHRNAKSPIKGTGEKEINPAMHCQLGDQFAGH